MTPMLRRYVGGDQRPPRHGWSPCWRHIGRPPSVVGAPRRRNREAIMATFILYLNWTEQGIKNAKDAPKRGQVTRAMAEKLGGRLLSAYITSGQHDVVLTVELPNGEAAAKLALGIGATGNARTATVRAYSVEEFAKLSGEIPAV
jgi:uncharacterized protein with GYD domain